MLRTCEPPKLHRVHGILDERWVPTTWKPKVFATARPYGEFVVRSAHLGARAVFRVQHQSWTETREREMILRAALSRLCAAAPLDASPKLDVKLDGWP